MRADESVPRPRSIAERELLPDTEPVARAATDETRVQAVRLARVRKSYGDVEALRDVSLVVHLGELFVVLGRNGAGKTTLFSLMCGLLRADSGEVVVCGRSVRSPRSVRETVGFAHQEIGLYERLTAIENLRFFGRLRGLSRTEITEAVDELASELELGPLAHRSVDRLSMGERRRVHIAGAFIGRPPVVVLDEPTAGVDVDTRGLIIELVGRRVTAGAAVCYSTHYFSEVEAMTNPTIAVLEHGAVVGCTGMDEMVAQHGRAGIELVFADGVDPTHIATRFSAAKTTGSSLWLEVERPETAVAAFLSRLDDFRDELRSVRIVEPSIETAFHALTGRPLD